MVIELATLRIEKIACGARPPMPLRTDFFATGNLGVGGVAKRDELRHVAHAENVAKQALQIIAITPAASRCHGRWLFFLDAKFVCCAAPACRASGKLRSSPTMREVTEFMVLAPVLSEDGQDPLTAKDWRVRLRVNSRDFHGAARSALRSIPSIATDAVIYVCRADTRDLRGYRADSRNNVAFIEEFGVLATT